MKLTLLLLAILGMGSGCERVHTSTDVKLAYTIGRLDGVLAMHGSTETYKDSDDFYRRWYK